jgi:hypothetical protein
LIPEKASCVVQKICRKAFWQTFQNGETDQDGDELIFQKNQDIIIFKTKENIIPK